jgi:GntR family transcriptional repressor for pyruvate dehydrogenase complex
LAIVSQVNGGWQNASISRGTMREALQFLVALGHIETRHGGGCFVRAATTDPEFMRKRWIDWVERHRSKILETIEVRLACETFAAELAARRAGPNELSQLVEALRIMQGALVSNDPTRFVQSDFAFHDALLTAASNSALRNLVVTMGKDLVPNRAALLSLPGRMEKSFAEHSAVYTAVQAGGGCCRYAQTSRKRTGRHYNVSTKRSESDLRPAC